MVSRMMLPIVRQGGTRMEQDHTFVQAARNGTVITLPYPCPDYVSHPPLNLERTISCADVFAPID